MQHDDLVNKEYTVIVVIHNYDPKVAMVRKIYNRKEHNNHTTNNSDEDFFL